MKVRVRVGPISRVRVGLGLGLEHFFERRSGDLRVRVRVRVRVGPISRAPTEMRSYASAMAMIGCAGVMDKVKRLFEGYG